MDQVVRLPVTPDGRHLREIFAAEPDRPVRHCARIGDLHVDWSRQPITDRVLGELHAVAEDAGVARAFARMASGERVNVTEGRAVMHMALRAPRSTVMSVDGVDVVPLVHEVLESMRATANRIRSDDRITDIVNIGIGGSDLGPAMAARALRAFSHPRLRSHFVSNVDGADIDSVLADLDPAHTIFIVVSKTFTTLETLTNARTARSWLVERLGPDAVSDHFIAVSTAAQRVAEFGIDPSALLGFWDWVGGRYSIWSAVGLSLMILIGPDRFDEFLAGAHAVDSAMTSGFGVDGSTAANPIVTLAMIGILNRDVLGRGSKAVIPYAQELDRLPAYLQQLDMESNGKSVRADGSPVSMPTGPVIWGEPGTNGQHAFFQLLHQGTDVIPVDFIGFARANNDLSEHQDLLMANLLAQAEALALGRDGGAEPHRHFPGDRPSTLILAEQLTPSTLGQLLALYEHIVFVQGVVWGIDSFDQWGVELGKVLASRITPQLVSDEPIPVDTDPTTSAAIAWYRRHRSR
jgi:glucose-6-phosphate isomerase